MESEDRIVKEFSQAMLDKINLRHARYAPMGWKTMDTKRLLMLLKEEIKELEEQGSDKAGEAIDIANYAMFIWALHK